MPVALKPHLLISFFLMERRRGMLTTELQAPVMTSGGKRKT
jgi:hypothetical protein